MKLNLFKINSKPNKKLENTAVPVGFEPTK